MRRPVERRGTTRRVAVADGREIGQGRGETGHVATERRGPPWEEDLEPRQGTDSQRAPTRG